MMQANPTSASVAASTLRPIRVFLLADDRLLRELLSSILRKDRGILVVGAYPYSSNAFVEVVESACDVLLFATHEVSSFADFLLFAALKQMNFRLVSLSVDGGIADLISSIYIACADRQPTIQTAPYAV
jgi:hypothetical protein